MTEVRRFTTLKSVHRRLQRAERGPVVIRDDRESRREVPGDLDARADPKAAGAPSLRLPASSVERADGLRPDLLVATVSDHHFDRGRPGPRHPQRWTTLQPEHASLPVRLPGQHLHPLLRRPRWDGSSGRAGSSA